MTMEEQLLQEGYVLTLPVGESMRPMLTQRKEQLLIERLTAEPKVNDVVLFRRGSGQYVLHRIVRRQGPNYRIRGDNCLHGETVGPQQIIGILKGFYRGDAFIDCATNRAYRRYVAVCRMGYPFRFVAGKCRQGIRGIVSRLRR